MVGTWLCSLCLLVVPELAAALAVSANLLDARPSRSPGGALDLLLAVDTSKKPRWFELDSGAVSPVLISPHAAENTNRREQVDLMIRNVTIVDPETERKWVDSVLIDDGAIHSLGSATVDDVRARRVIEGEGLYLLPGLADMHVHLAEDEVHPDALETLVKSGVTTVRDAGGDPVILAKWKERIRKGDELGPEILVSGPTLNGPEDDSLHLEVSNEESARAAVASVVASGAEFVKTHRYIRPDLLTVIIKEAHRHGLPVYGHIPLGMTPLEACEAGLDGIEHIGSFLESLASTAEDPSGGLGGAIRALTSDGSDDFIECLAAREVEVTPTLVIYRYLGGDDPEANQLGERTIAALRPFVKKLSEAGVPLLAGTDAPLGDASIPWGEAVIEELELLESSGISIWEVLRIGTRTANRSRSPLDAGREADFVLLRQDPSVTLAALRDLAFVVLDGTVVEPGT